MGFSCGAHACPTHSSAEHSCQAWRLARLQGTVGTKGKNKLGDVRAVQGGLNRIIGPAGPQPRLETHGKLDDATVHAIAAFARYALGSESRDLLIEPNGRAYRALAA
jgi:hypothetical protein